MHRIQKGGIKHMQQAYCFNPGQRPTSRPLYAYMEIFLIVLCQISTFVFNTDDYILTKNKNKTKTNNLKTRKLK